MHLRSKATMFLVLLLFLAACSPENTITGPMQKPPPTHATVSPLTPTATDPVLDVCPSILRTVRYCYTPHALRVAYGLETLMKQGFTGRGQTVVDIVSYGSPTLQQDMDVFSQQFGLPPITIQVLSPLGTVPFDPKNKDMLGWAYETELDVQIIHAIAPDASIVVMTSPVDETEGTIGLPEFLKLEQYAVTHRLGQIFSQSYVASEPSLSDSAGRQLVATYTDFYKQITTQEGWTIVSGSGDNGATDWADVAMTHFSSTPIVNFPADVPWVTAVGGTSLFRTEHGYGEHVWSSNGGASGGGMSKFFPEPDFQLGMPQTVQKLLAGHRGLPDIAADADPYTGMAFYVAGQWNQVGGTSASTPLWAGIIAVANQIAGHPLGFINPGIYKLGIAEHAHNDFRDVIVGDNSIYRQVQVQGFPATAGWDAVTGWGSPLASQFIPDLIAALK